MISVTKRKGQTFGERLAFAADSGSGRIGAPVALATDAILTSRRFQRQALGSGTLRCNSGCSTSPHSESALRYARADGLCRRWRNATDGMV